MGGGGNPLNIIRIGGALEQFNIILENDLNGCISNLLVGTGNYSLTWNSSYPFYTARDMTQNNIDSRYHYIATNNKKDEINYLIYHATFYEVFCQKDSFNTTYGISNLRPIIEFRE